MADKSVTLRLLSLFTSEDRAEAIEGDLLEERETYGRAWFVVTVVATAFALWRQAVAFEFLRIAALSAAAVGLSCLVCGALELVQVELGVLGPSRAATLLTIAAFAFLLGAGLVRAAPVIGVTAAVATTVVLVLMFLYAQIDVRAEQWRAAADESAVAATVDAVALSIRNLAAAALLYLLPLILGSVLMHGRAARA